MYLMTVLTNQSYLGYLDLRNLYLVDKYRSVPWAPEYTPKPWYSHPFNAYTYIDPLGLQRAPSEKR